jgi:hypothetical protein
LKDELDPNNTPVVRLEDGTMGVVLSLGAHSSLVVYESGGYEYEVYMPNEDFEIVDYIAFDYEDEE